MKTTALLVTFVGLVAGFAAEPAPPARPNILFIAVDDLRPMLGCYGDPVAITPNLDRLAQRGTLFARAYCQQAVCNASRSSLLSGRRPDSIRVWDLKTEFRETTPEVVPLPEHFKRNGYFTQSLGKIYHDGIPDPQSWSVPAQFEGVSKRENYHTEANLGPRAGGKATATEFADGSDDDYPDGKVATAAVAALQALSHRAAAQPFFLAVGVRKPHLPFAAPRKYLDLYAKVKIPDVEQPEPPRGAPALALHDNVELRGYSDQPQTGPWSPEQVATLRRGYYAAATFADAQIGRVLDALEKTGLAESTIVVVWGDHGYHLGEHGLWSKISNYEADAKVPLLIAVPGKKGGVRTDALVELVDLYPTLSELCGLPVQPKLEGTSIVANIGNPAVPGHAVAITQFPRPWWSGRKLPSPKTMGYAARDATHRYVEWRDLEKGGIVARELYTYVGDEMFEHVNLADDPASQPVINRLAALLPPSPAKVAAKAKK